MSESHKIEELILDVELLKNVVSLLIDAGGYDPDKLLSHFERPDMVERLRSLVALGTSG